MAQQIVDISLAIPDTSRIPRPLDDSEAIYIYPRYE